MKLFLRLICFLLLGIFNSQIYGQELYDNFDHLEISLIYKHSLKIDGYKHIRLLKNEGSCECEIRNSRPIADTAWRMTTPDKKFKIDCGQFKRILSEFTEIKNSELLFHNKDEILLDGFGLEMELSNLNSRISYSLQSPDPKDVQIENFIRTANSILNFDDSNLKKLIK